uniref:Ribonuclease H-like domain-containing protein n=1 Tax=Tanacetum cinerariifolium TaxID=118510 RepID=A0A6L2KHH0_TANCI|nr:ribonuclease H-like domain-containing protein [Tanacetum cinerariifolium]
MVSGLPRLKFQKDHLCSACALGKSKKHSHKPKAEDSIKKELYLLHMDLYGPMRIQSINGRKYILVIVDDFTRFTWVKFLRSKDEVPEFVIKFLKMIQVYLNATVHNIITDSGLGPNPPAPTPYVPPTKKDWYMLFQPMFDEYFNPPPSAASLVPAVVAPKPVDSTGTPSLTIIDQDAPSLKNGPRIIQWILSLAIPHDPSLQDIRYKMKSCFATLMLSLLSLNQRNKEALKEACWIESMQEELNKFEQFEVWELVPHLDRVMIITLKWIFKVKLDELGGVWKNMASMAFLGHIVSAEEITMDPAKVEAITKWPRPTSVTELSHVHDVFHVSLLRGYKYHPLHVISYPLDQIRTDLSYVEEPEAILDRQDRVMRKKTIPFVKILWRNHSEREAT